MGNEGEQTVDDVLEALAGAVPIVGPAFGLLAKELSDEVRSWRKRRVSRALAAAERVSGMDRETLSAAIATEPRLIPLLTRVLHAAGMNGHDETLEVMGGALGHATVSDERLDEAELVLTAIADLGPHHFEVLRTVAELTEPTAEGGHRRRAEPQEVIDRSDLPERLARLALAQLAPAGLIDKSGGFGGGDFCDMTELGHLLLEVIDEYSAE